MTLNPLLRSFVKESLAIITIALLLLAAWLLWGAGFFRPEGEFPNAEDLNRIGGFVAGVLSPIVLAWAARGFYLQRKQLLDSMDAMAQQARLMAKQAELQNAANAQQAAQLAALERHREEDARLEAERTAPRFSLRSITNSRSAYKGGYAFQTEITNVGALAVGYALRLSTTGQIDGMSHVVHELEDSAPFLPGESRTVTIVLPSRVVHELVKSGYTCEIDAMRSDQRVTYQVLSTNEFLNYFEPQTFQAVANDRAFRLAVFGGSAVRRSR
jgi:hypothetical protein